jgi:hypothetical protein
MDRNTNRRNAMRTIRRIHCFLAIVWRYPTGPGPGESWHDFRSTCPRIDIRQAWGIACEIFP